MGLTMYGKAESHGALFWLAVNSIGLIISKLEYCTEACTWSLNKSPSGNAGEDVDSSKRIHWNGVGPACLNGVELERLSS